MSHRTSFAILLAIFVALVIATPFIVDHVLGTISTENWPTR